MQLTGKRFNTKDAYAALEPTVECEDLHGKYIWRTAVPNKVKIFAWLYFKDRLSSRFNLHRKHVLRDDICERCSSMTEDRYHIFFGCLSISSIWQRLCFSAAPSLTDEEIWRLEPPNGLGKELWPSILLTILWRLWDARNGEIFRHEPLLDSGSLPKAKLHSAKPLPSAALGKEHTAKN